MTSPLCWAAATHAVSSQEQISAPSSKAKGTKVQSHRGKALGRAQAWPAQRLKGKASYHTTKSFVHAQMIELQRKIQLLGKMAAEGTEESGINRGFRVGTL